MKELNDLKMKNFIKNDFACILFYVEWSQNCINFIKILEDLCIKFSNIKFGKINLEECIVSPTECKVASAPTLVLFKNGKRIEIIDRFMDKDKVIEKLNKLRGTSENSR